MPQRNASLSQSTDANGGSVQLEVVGMIYSSSNIKTSTVAAGDETEQNYVDALTFLYDGDDKLVGFIDYNGKYNYYGRNAQGDIVEIYSEDSALLCRYVYDSWGKLISVKDASGADMPFCICFSTRPYAVLGAGKRRSARKGWQARIGAVL